MTMRGTPVLRREDRALLTSGGLFVADRRLAGALHVTFVTATMAHARLRGVDVAAARAAPGVLDVVIAADLAGDGAAEPALGPEPLANPQLDAAMRRPLLATERVRFVGEPIAAIVATDAYRAVDAAGLVEVDYEPLPVVVDPEAALARGRPAALRRDRGRQPGRPPRGPRPAGRLRGLRGDGAAAHRQQPAGRLPPRDPGGGLHLGGRPARPLLGGPGHPSGP